ncbi:M23 family metallopeptidase [Lysobacter niastensis]|uniref:M23 family metallopeptidase n=1 Tax=Lysobacter niastensis TaxID=380629 RepID=A0ABS0B6W9_9GAMM|nr:M23 family metallopeptidase [Lysobacter niastensis]MBF6023437.1 M23 family metallopeptidase [Lysobacter niastensis]
MRFWKTRIFKASLAVMIAVLAVGYLIPERAIIPVQGASTRDWNSQSFWYEPWGQSGVHKGIDIFAPDGRPVVAPVSGIVLFRGDMGIGGRAIIILGPRWHFHYFAHLSQWHVSPLSFVSRGQRVGDVGTSGNAAGKPPHLHYAITSLLPRPWRISSATQGWKRMFFLDPNGVVGGT